MEAPTHTLNFTLKIKDRERVSAFVRGRGVHDDLPLSDQVLQAYCVQRGRAEKDVGFDVVFASVVNEPNSAYCQLDVEVRVARPDILNEAAIVAMKTLRIGPEAETFPSTSSQIAMTVLARNLRDGEDAGVEMCHVPADSQEGVRLSWVYPDEDGGHVPAYVDPITGYVSHQGSLPADIGDGLVRKRVEVDDDLYDVVNVRTADERSFWVLRPSALVEFNNDLAAQSAPATAPGLRG